MSDQDSQLSIFAWKSSTQIFAFPLHRRVGKIRSVIQVYCSHSSEKWRDAYIERTNRDLRSHLKKIGLSKSEIVDELEAFGSELNIEFEWVRAERQG